MARNLPKRNKMLYPGVNIAGIFVHTMSLAQTADYILEQVKAKARGKYIVIANANDIVCARKNRRVKEAMDMADLTVPDGMSLVLLARLKGHPVKQRVYGPDLTMMALPLAQEKGYRHFFYGARQETLDLLVHNLNQRFGQLKIAGTYAPGFRALTVEEDDQIVEMINQSGADILWIGLGCPKQQLWI